MSIKQPPDFLIDGRLPEWLGGRCIPDWLPHGAKAYIVGLIIYDLSIEKNEAERKAIRLLLPAFCHQDMKRVWKKLASISESAVFSYTMAIASGEHNFMLAKEYLYTTRQYAEKLEKINSQAQKLCASIQKIKSPWLDVNLIERAKALSETTEINYKAALAAKSSATSKNPPHYYGRLTRNQLGKAKEHFYIRSLSGVIRYHSDTLSLHDEIAITVNTLFDTNYIGENVKKMVGRNPKKGTLARKNKF